MSLVEKIGNISLSPAKLISQQSRQSLTNTLQPATKKSRQHKQESVTMEMGDHMSSSYRQQPQQESVTMETGDHVSSGGSSRGSRLSSTITQEVMKEGYRLGKTIGIGSYSCVRLAYNLKNNNQLVACKIINKEKASDKFLKKFLPRELSILKSLKHPHIVRVLSMFTMGNRIFVFMNYCSMGDLLDYIRDNGHFKEEPAKVLFRQLLSALKYLHGMHIAHRDLKCENILLARRDSLTLTDFGFSRHFTPGVSRLSTTFCGSAAYAAPEIIEGVAYNPHLGDIWSLGCVLYIMLTATMPFDDANIPSMVRVQKERSLKFPRERRSTAQAKVYVMRMLEPEPKLRASLAQLEASPWLSSVGLDGRIRQGVAKVLGTRDSRAVRKP